jgi:Copper type II ascorbate-dependent monooxygenase, C-terminal domain
MTYGKSVAVGLVVLAGLGCSDGAVLVDGGAEGLEMDLCTEDSTEMCVDEEGVKMCPLDTGWDGDALHPCEEDDAMILHYGPSDYDDEEDVARFTMEPNSEMEDCVFVRAPNKEEVFIGAYNGRMRPNSHHLIVTTWDELPEGVTLGEPYDCGLTSGLNARWLLGSQEPKIDLGRGGSVRGAPPAEKTDPDYKLGTRLPAGQYLRLNLHYINATDKPILREAWVKLQIVPKDDVKTQVDMITFFQGSINVPPGGKGVSTAIGKCTAPSDRYVSLMTGHFHANTTRFTAWHNTEDGKTKQVYETYDYHNPGNAFYVDRSENPDADREMNQWGATSGYLFVKKGESISFQCEYDNPSEETVTLGELGKDQMCNVFGMYFPSDGEVWSCQCLGTVCF